MLRNLHFYFPLVPLESTALFGVAVPTPEPPSQHNQLHWWDSNCMPFVYRLYAVCYCHLFIIKIIFNGMYLHPQTNSTFVIQGMHMNISMNNGWAIPVAWLALTNVIFVLVFVPVIHKGLFPWLEKRKIRLPAIAKILIGKYTATAYLRFLKSKGLFQRMLIMASVNFSLSWTSGPKRLHASLRGMNGVCFQKHCP